MELTFNGTKINLPPGISIWGEFLEWFEYQMSPGHCISRVYFDGKRESQFSRRAILDTALEDFALVEIESREIDAVIRENLSELQAELSLALDITQDIIGQFANNSESGAMVQLIQVLKSIHSLFSVMPTDLGWVRPAHVITDLEAAISQLTVTENELIQSSIGEILERDVTPILESCHESLEQTRVRIG